MFQRRQPVFIHFTCCSSPQADSCRLLSQRARRLTAVVDSRDPSVTPGSLSNCQTLPARRVPHL